MLIKTTLARKGVNMSSILIPILIASFVGYQLDELKMKKYDMSDSEGKIVKVQFSKNGKYSCPLNCCLNHHHYATLNKDSKKAYEFWTVDSSIDKDGFNRYEINGNTMDSYTVFKTSKKMPKQSIPMAYNNKDND